jgi:hypothetical protein
MSSLDMAVVKQLFSSLATAQAGEPNYFAVDVTNPDGMNQLRVIVCDELTFRVLTKGREILLKSMDSRPEKGA